MPLSSGLSHVAMSVPEGTLTEEYRARLLVGSSSYINIRERPDSMVSHGYEHFGILVRSAEVFQQLWADLANEQVDVQLEPLSTNDEGEGSFRFRYLLPMAVEVQFYAELSER